jgi:tetratricopeptide (TPR) repeat protein
MQNSGNKKNRTDYSKIIEPSSKNLYKISVKQITFLLLAIVVITLIAYYPVFKNNFITWDDQDYVVNNHEIQNINSENIKNYFTNNYVCDYLPFTMLSFAADYQIGGLNPKVYIITNFILHIFNTLFVFWLAYLLFLQFKDEITQSKSKPMLFASITSLLFAIHPLNIESVAWVSERKNVLFVFFFLLSIIGYIKYITTEKLFFLFLSIILFIFSLLSKGTAASLPLCIIAIDYFYKRKLLSKKVIVEKIPYIILSLIFGIVAIIGQGKDNIGTSYPIYANIIFASFGFISYVIKLLFPVSLSAIYPYPISISWKYWISFTATIALIIVLFKFRKHFSRFILFSIIFFIANIILLIQLFPFGDAIMADRYIYLSSIGYFLIISFLIIKYSDKFSFLFILLGIYLLFLVYMTNIRIKVWNNSIVFWTSVIENNPNIATAWSNRGAAEFKNLDENKALADYNKAISINPEYYKAYYNRGELKASTGDLNGAISDYNTAINIKPNYTLAYYNRGIVKKDLKLYKSALEDFNTVISLDPNFNGVYNARGIINYYLGNSKEALEDLNKAIAMDPNNLDAISNKNLLLNFSNKNATDLIYKALNEINLKNFKQAYELLQKSIKIKETSIAYQMIGSILYQNKDINSLYYFEKANQLKPNDPDILNNLFILYIIKKNYSKASQCLDELKNLTSDKNKLLRLQNILDKSKK